MNRYLLSKLQQPLKQSSKKWIKNNNFVRLNSTTATTTTAATFISEARPSTLKKMVTYNHPTAPLSSFNQRLALELRHRGESSNNQRVLDNVLKIVEEIKQQNLRMDLNTYNAILAAYSRNNRSDDIKNTIEEMKNNGIKITIDTYNLILEALANTKSLSFQAMIREEMKENGVGLTVHSYHSLLKAASGCEETEHVLNILDEMKQTSSTQPNLACYSIGINICIRNGEVQTAFDLLKEAEKANLAVESRPQLYMNLMRVSARQDNEDVTSYCWSKVVTSLALRPDEGTCLDVLRVASKSGNTKLATDIIRQLSTTGYPYKEHYFTPLMEAFLIKQDIKSAFNVLDIMRASGITPNKRATLPIRTHLDKNVDAIDKAYYVLEEMHKENKTVDISAFNVVVEACADAGDVERAIATYREAKNLNVIPNIETYNAVLRSCIRRGMKGMGNVVVDELKKAGINPNLETYTNMIRLACTQRSYEDAFTYLEEMKGYDIVPPSDCYITLAKKLSYEKDPRFHMVLEEMETFGYRIPYSVRENWTMEKRAKH